ncbi:MAG: DEAD/DEAH box helicase, partial [Moorella sp. (in: Bacteria)]|nr:DEAD/DEAH box helicase [Moorella sp. (in: firmicutes)]
LGSQADFRSRFMIPIERYRDRERAGRLQHLVQPFILRRVKTDPSIIQDLPEKQEIKVFCHLTREQATLYEAVVQDMLQKIEAATGIERKGLVLATLAKLKQICNHPAQFLGDGSLLDGRSGKLTRLQEMLEEVLAAGERGLIFTQFAVMGQMLQEYLESTFGREVLFLHGGLARARREELIRRFQEENNGPLLFILSLKAGGVGLNLTRANHVFHFDRWWNPAVEDQATDRAFRIGQKKNVQVYKFICAGTLEERIDALIEEKRALAQQIIGTGEGWLTELSTGELRELLALKEKGIDL